MTKEKVVVTLYLLVFSTVLNGQTIKGNVQFQSDRSIYTWVFLEIDGKRTECDSIGKFELKEVHLNDTLNVNPIPIFIKVKIYNLPSNLESIELISIPLFQKVVIGHPMINFRSKRASKQYFKQVKIEKQLEEDELTKRIQDYRYIWNGNEYKLELIKSNENYTILINLNQ